MSYAARQSHRMSLRVTRSAVRGPVILLDAGRNDEIVGTCKVARGPVSIAIPLGSLQLAGLARKA
jgi:hypothetical protein